MTGAAWKRIASDLRRDYPAGRTPTPVILDSWQRSLDAGIDPDAQIDLRRVDHNDLLRRQRHNRALLHHASGLIDAFSARVQPKAHVVYMTDAEGIVLYSRGTNTLMQSYGLRPGFDWSEAAMGSNGAGTALASRLPVAVIGADHWLAPFRSASCLGAPLFNGEGKPIGAVDLSTHVSDCDPADLGKVIELARAIESGLKFG